MSNVERDIDIDLLNVERDIDLLNVILILLSVILICWI